MKMRMGPSGIHLFSRASGTNLLLDEFVPPEEVWAAAPRQVSIALTNACDLACSYCFAPKVPATLAFDSVVSWLRELDVNGTLGVGFGGGEPTLYPLLTELCSYAAKKTNLALTMTTHAHKLSDQLLNDLAGTLHLVRVSMDGIGSTYESIRNRPFDRLLERITAIGRVARFGINFVVNSKTIGNLDQAIQLATDLGAFQFLLLPEEPAGPGSGIDYVTAIRLREWVKGYRGSMPLAISEGDNEGFPTCDPLSAESGLAAFAHIDASGIIKRTSFDQGGITIQENGVIAALDKLKKIKQEEIQ